MKAISPEMEAGLLAETIGQIISDVVSRVEVLSPLIGTMPPDIGKRRGVGDYVVLGEVS